MPRFLVRLLSAFIPVKSWRKAFRKKIKRKDLFGDLKAVFTEIKTKRDTALRCKDSCNIIALGSSHGAYSFNPEFIGKNSFNLCTNSQDLYTAEQILKYMQEKLPHLKQVVVFLDVFTRGWRLDRTSAEHICASYNYLYDVYYPLFDDKHHYLKHCKGLDKKKLKITENKNGYLNPPKLNFTDSVEARAQGHLKEHNREESQYDHLTNIIKLASNKNMNVYILIPPIRNDYKNLLPSDLLLSDAKQLTKGTKAKILDFSKDTDFIDDDFYDYDHLNPVGAEKLSRKLKGLL